MTIRTVVITEHPIIDACLLDDSHKVVAVGDNEVLALIKIGSKVYVWLSLKTLTISKYSYATIHNAVEMATESGMSVYQVTSTKELIEFMEGTYC